MSKRILIRLISVIIYIPLVIRLPDADIRGDGLTEIFGKIIIFFGYSVSLYYVFLVTKPKHKNEFYLQYLAHVDNAYTMADSMTKADKIHLSTNELVSVLNLCGYNNFASRILYEQNLTSNEAEFTHLVQEAEVSLKQKGYWDDNKDSKVAGILENLLYLLVYSEKEAHCANMTNRSVLLIHSLRKRRSLVEEVRNGEHSFYFLNKEDSFHDILREHHGLEDSEISVEGCQPIEMTAKRFDELCASEPAVLQAMINDEAQPQCLRVFCRAFLKNGQKFDAISYMSSNNARDASELHLLPSDDYIWHLDYSKVKTENKVRIDPIPIRSYFEKVERILADFFDDSIKNQINKFISNHKQKKQKVKNNREFSLKDGWRVLKKANIILFIMSLVFSINATDWDSIVGILLFIFLTEFFIVLLAFAGCFTVNNRKEKSHRSKDKEDKKQKRIGLGISVIGISLLSLIFQGEGVPFPSTIIMLMIITNLMIAFISLIFHLLIIDF